MKFFNWTDEDFTYSWAGINYTFRAGEVVEDVAHGAGGSRLLLEPGHINHFAKHLADREMNKQNINPGRLDVKEDFMRRAIDAPSSAKVAEAKKEVMPEPAEVQEVVAEEFTCDDCGKTAKSKAGLAAHKRSHKKSEDII